MILYRYDDDTKEYICSFEAYIDPLESAKQNKPIYVIPPCTTLVEPMEARVGYVAVFNGEKWEEKEDHRGLMVWRGSELVMIEDLGPIPDDCSLERRYSLKELKEAKLLEINEEFNKVYSGKVKIRELEIRIDESGSLKGTIEAFKEFKEFPFNGCVISVEEAEEAIKKLYEKSMFLVQRKKELEENLKVLKDKEAVKNFKISFTK